MHGLLAIAGYAKGQEMMKSLRAPFKQEHRRPGGDDVLLVLFLQVFLVLFVDESACDASDEIEKHWEHKPNEDVHNQHRRDHRKHRPHTCIFTFELTENENRMMIKLNLLSSFWSR